MNGYAHRVKHGILRKSITFDHCLFTTTQGGNVSDSVYIKLTLNTDNVKFISSLVPEGDWAKPGVPEYAWTQQAGSNSVDASKDEHWTLAGYRYTGYPEDM